MYYLVSLLGPLIIKLVETVILNLSALTLPFCTSCFKAAGKITRSSSSTVNFQVSYKYELSDTDSSDTS